MKILCVDDHVDCCNLLAMLLRNSGHDVSCAYSGEGAWEKFKSAEFDCLLVDQWLGDTMGSELCSRLRKSGCTSPVIFVSGATDPDSRSRICAAGGTGFVEKPYSLD